MCVSHLDQKQLSLPPIDNHELDNFMKRQGEIRIIGGQWRGRKIAVPDVAGVRPTPDRVRETVFNWLMPYVKNAYCLDAYAGSGALGFEALSRGAQFVVFVDTETTVIKQLAATATLLKTNCLDIVQAKFPRQFNWQQSQFNLVFLDPPFSKNYLPGACHFLEENQLLSDEAIIYLECEAALEVVDIPDNWQIIKQQQAGDVQFALIKRTAFPG
jgi:16S rRNA (guanine966-N2)-methyltransferase